MPVGSVSLDNRPTYSTITFEGKQWLADKHDTVFRDMLHTAACDKSTTG